MKQSEFLRWLKSKSVQAENGKRHIQLKGSNGKIQHLPRHPSKEVDESLRKTIIKDLGLKEGK